LMRREYDLPAAQQRPVGWQRLDVEHVQVSAAEMAAFQSCDERVVSKGER